MTQVSRTAALDGATTHVIECTASDLPPVRTRDVVAAWDLARDAALRGASDHARRFRFRREDGGWTDLVLWDRDAACWAGAVDRAVGMGTGYGVSVCLRLLALVELLQRSPWASSLASFDRSIARLHPTLLRLVAESPLTDEAHFDEALLRARLDAQSPQPHTLEA